MSKTFLKIALTPLLFLASFSAADTTEFTFNDGLSDTSGSVSLSGHIFEEQQSQTWEDFPVDLLFQDGAVALAPSEYIGSPRTLLSSLDFNEPKLIDIRFKYVDPITLESNRNFQREVLTTSTNDQRDQGFTLLIEKNTWDTEWRLKFKMADGAGLLGLPNGEGYLKDLGVVDPYSWQDVSIAFSMGGDTPEVGFVVNGTTDILVLDQPQRGDVASIVAFLSGGAYASQSYGARIFMGDSPIWNDTNSNDSTLLIDNLSFGDIPDSDGDGTLDYLDAFPNDPSESLDTDGDGIGNNSDDDIDGDGALNGDDAFPNDPSEILDTDGDGIGNNTDTDEDGDGIPDGLDASPLDPSANLEFHGSKGLSGFFYMNSEHPDSDGDGYGERVGLQDSYGHSWYSSVFSLTDRHLAGFQVGLGSTILTPQNEDFFSPLCPAGTVAGDLFTGSAEAFYRGAFQTLEGGLGSWLTSKFPSPTPKFGITGTGYCYTGGFSAPGWGFEDDRGLGERFERSKRATAQLSNRLLISPDGLTFNTDTGGEFLGLAWMALPLIDARDVYFGDNTSPTPVGNNSWTLFFNASNFKGPLLFVMPDEWADLSSSYPVIEGRGFDARPSSLYGMLMEFNSVPHFTQQVSAEITVSKIPELSFPVNHEGHSVIVHSITDYTKDAFFNVVGDWFEYSVDPLTTEFNYTETLPKECRNEQFEIEHGMEDKRLTGLDDTVEAHILDDNCSLAMKWNQTPGEFPQYFIEENEEIRVATRQEVVSVTSEQDTAVGSELFDAEFPSVMPGSRGEFDLYNSGCWDDSLSVGDPVAYMSDGSEIHYSWFKFIDQPTIRCSNLSQEEKDELQRRVELIHANWDTTANYIAPPTIGELARFDDAALVTPPPGFEVGYVPIIRRQVAAIDTDDDNVLDGDDAFPLDATETIDTDSDGTGNNADTDDDNDGVADSDDAFPFDSAESSDSDGDGLGDNADAFPNDSSETVDSDLDGIGDNEDVFPNDPTESADTDLDGVGDNADAFPNDASETLDSDSDGTGDNADAFPNNALYKADSDLDGMPDAWETRYGLDPNDASDATSDRDNDGVTALDEFIAGTIPSGSIDLDGNDQYDALTDGLLLLRGMFGLDGSALVTGTIASDATYTESVDIESRIATLGDLADIDGNGDIDALTDGLLTLRYLFGLQGDTLINGVVASDATRKTAEEIEAHLQTLMPAL